MNKKQLIVYIIMMVLISGCTTPYQRFKSDIGPWTGGYCEVKIQDDIFRVEFRYRIPDNRGRVYDFTLLRCAEITLENDYRFFTILDKKDSNFVFYFTIQCFKEKLSNISNIYDAKQIKDNIKKQYEIK